MTKTRTKKKKEEERELQMELALAHLQSLCHLLHAALNFETTDYLIVKDVVASLAVSNI